MKLLFLFCQVAQFVSAVTKCSEKDAAASVLAVIITFIGQHHHVPAQPDHLLNIQVENFVHDTCPSELYFHSEKSLL